MSTYLDYLAASQYDSFYDEPINELDLAMLTEFAYLPLKGIIPYAFDKSLGVRLDDAIVQLKQQHPKLEPFQYQMMDLVENGKRFKHIKAFGFVDDFNINVQKQFSAIVFQLQPHTFVVAFRGTDDTIIGWKEDFHMTYMAEVPSQKSAVGYTQKLLTHLKESVILTGHSKGGNLAVYAASLLPSDLQALITDIYTYDAPGLHKQITSTDGFATIKDKIHAYIPNDSVVGLMLEHPEEATIVKSAGISLDQHRLITWEVAGNQFARADRLTTNSLQTDQTLKSWTEQLSDHELKDFFDLFFGLFLQAGIYRVHDIGKDTFGNMSKIVSNAQNLTPDEKALLLNIAGLLAGTRFDIWRQALPTLDINNLLTKLNRQKD